MADTRSKSYAIVQLSHEAESLNSRDPTGYVLPMNIMFMHNDLSKAIVRFHEIVDGYKTVSATEKCQYDVLYKGSHCAEIRKVHGGYVYNSKEKVLTIALLEYAFGQAERQ